MSYALVGSEGSVATAAAGSAVNPSYGQSPSANDLLICWVAGYGGTTNPTQPSGWSTGELTGTPHGGTATIFYKVAAGGDGAPSIAAATSIVWFAQLAEFSGNATSSPLDQVGTTSNTGTTPIVPACASTDVALGELVVYCIRWALSSAATVTTTNTMNNGATPNDTKNDGTSTAQHYNFGYGITTGNSSADQTSNAESGGTLSNGDAVICSFKLGTSTLKVNRPNVVGQAVQRAANWCSEFDPSARLWLPKRRIFLPA